MNMGTLKKLLILSNVLLLASLGGVIFWVFQQIKSPPDDANRLLLNKPPVVEIIQDAGHGLDYYGAIASLEIGPRVEKIDTGGVKKEEPDWELGFQQKWKVVSAPWVFSSNPSKSWAILQDTQNNQKRARQAPSALSVEDLLKLMKHESLTISEEEEGGARALAADIPPETAILMVIDDATGRLFAKVSAVDARGIEITNSEGKTTRINFSATDHTAKLTDPGTKGSGGPLQTAQMPTQTRNIGPDTWEIGATDQVDFSENYATYLDEVTLRAYYDQRTRKLQGLQVRAKVSNPKFTKFGIVNRDVIVKVNGTPVSSTEDIQSLISSNRDAPTVKVEVLRNGRTKEITYNLKAKGKGAPVETMSEPVPDKPLYLDDPAPEPQQMGESTSPAADATAEPTAGEGNPQEEEKNK